MPRAPLPDMLNNNQWHADMPQPLANLDSRIPSQRMNYYPNGHAPSITNMPPASATAADGVALS